MSNNAPDYENLVFKPKSADDMNKQERQSDVLISAIERCEILEAENQQLKKLLRECRDKIISDLDNARLCESSVDIEDFEYLLNRIDNVIGEK